MIPSMGNFHIRSHMYIVWYVFHRTWWNCELSSHHSKETPWHAVNLIYMCLTESGFKNALHMHLTTDMHLIKEVHGKWWTA